MRAEEIERFFAARVVGPDALAMAVHERATDRLIGTCAFSQLDGENGSALYHITIGEPDTWGNGYGTEATQLMVDHAFGSLGLHRVSLYVFEFNERAIRAYQRCGFVDRRPGTGIDLARRPVVGRAGDERARVRLARAAGGHESGDAPRPAVSPRASPRNRPSPWVPALPTCCDARSAGGDDNRRARPPMLHGRTFATSSPRRDTRLTTPGPRSSGSMLPSPQATWSGRRRWTCTWPT